MQKNGPALDLVPPQLPPVQVTISLIHGGCVRPLPRLPSLPPPSIAFRVSSPNPPRLPARPPHGISAEPTWPLPSAAPRLDHTVLLNRSAAPDLQT